MKKIKIVLIFTTLTLAISLTVYGTYKRYSNLKDTMDIQQSIFQLVELKSANANWDFELNQIHSNNFPHFDRVNQAAAQYQNQMQLFLETSKNIQGPMQDMLVKLEQLSANKKSMMNEYLSEVAVTRNSLKFLDTLLFNLQIQYQDDDIMLKYLAYAQYQLSLYVALNQNIQLKQHANTGQCFDCTIAQKMIIKKVSLHLAILKKKVLLSHKAKDAFYSPVYSDFYTELFDELSLVYAKEDAKNQTIQSQIITITGILVITVIALLGFLYWIYRTFEEHRKAGITDPLTGLFNRKRLFDSLSDVMATHEKSEKKLALLFIDLDGFKKINDTYGHDMGDKLLQAFSARLANQIRKKDAVYRIGGDEFVVLVQELSGVEDAEFIAKNILSKCCVPYQLDDTFCQITLSIGISFYPDHSTAPKSLIKLADKAMYQSKSKGKNRVSVWQKG